MDISCNWTIAVGIGSDNHFSSYCRDLSNGLRTSMGPETKSSVSRQSFTKALLDGLGNCSDPFFIIFPCLTSPNHLDLPFLCGCELNYRTFMQSMYIRTRHSCCLANGWTQTCRVSNGFCSEVSLPLNAHRPRRFLSPNCCFDVKKPDSHISGAKVRSSFGIRFPCDARFGQAFGSLQA